MPWIPATQMGPAVTDIQLAGNLKYVDIAIKEGGRLLAGGADALKLDTPGHYMSPTLIVDTKASATPSTRKKCSDPVVSVVKIKDYEEGLAHVQQPAISACPPASSPPVSNMRATISAM